MPRRKATPNNNNAGEVGEPPKKRGRPRAPFHLELPQRRQIIGNVLVCGNGETGQLGLGEDVFERKRLAIVESIPNAVDVVAGGMHCLVLTANGELYSFGCNDEGALGRDTSEDGSEALPALIELPKPAICISAGDSHSACLLEDGSVYAWGSFRDSHGNMGLTNDGNKRKPINLLEGVECCKIASGADHLVILTRTGKVFTVGCAEQGQLGRISERSVAGEGRRGKHDLLRPDIVFLKLTKPFADIWATNYCTFLKESQTDNIYAVGLNNYYQLTASESKPDRILNPVKTSLTDVKDIAGGQHHTLVLKNDNTCFAVGRPEYGRLGLGKLKDVVDKLTPIKALAAHKIASVACGEACSYAITVDGKLYSWGIGSNNQLGVGDGDDELEPVLVESKNTQNKRILIASGGGQHSIFLSENPDAAKKTAKSVPKKKEEEKKIDSPKTVNEPTPKENDTTTEPYPDAAKKTPKSVVTKKKEEEKKKDSPKTVNEPAPKENDTTSEPEKEKNNDNATSTKRGRKKK